MESKRTTGIVKGKLSRSTYIVELSNGDNIELHLKARHVLNYMNLPIGKTIYLELIPPDNNKGTLLTATDYKMNNWTGGPDPNDY